LEGKLNNHTVYVQMWGVSSIIETIQHNLPAENLDTLQEKTTMHDDDDDDDECRIFSGTGN
jgi:hypothetical protein